MTGPVRGGAGVGDIAAGDTGGLTSGDGAAAGEAGGVTISCPEAGDRIGSV